MEAPETQSTTEILGLFAKILAPIVALVLGAMSYVWSVARSAKRCAFDARLKIESADAATQATVTAIRDLKEDVQTGFKGIHERLDRHLEG